MEEKNIENNNQNHEPLVDAKRKIGKIRRIVVDRDACIAARSCVVVAPGVFQMDEEDLAYIVDPDASDDDILRMAAESCPTLAIKLYDEEGNQVFPAEGTINPLG